MVEDEKKINSMDRAIYGCSKRDNDEKKLEDRSEQRGFDGKGEDKFLQDKDFPLKYHVNRNKE